MLGEDNYRSLLVYGNDGSLRALVLALRPSAGLIETVAKMSVLGLSGVSKRFRRLATR